MRRINNTFVWSFQSKIKSDMITTKSLYCIFETSILVILLTNTDRQTDKRTDIVVKVVL